MTIHNAWAKSLAYCFLLLCALSTSFSAEAQYARGNSPYSRYGLGNLQNSQFGPASDLSGGLNASYNRYTDVNLVNPASFGFLRYTSLQVGLFYQYDRMSEQSTGLNADAHDGNLSYISLAFPITKSWEIKRDTLRRELPIQWGMGFSLVPHSVVSYDVAVTRNLPDIGDILYSYRGKGTRYRVNWSNGVEYKNVSIGANLGLVFGRVEQNSTQLLADSVYNLSSFNLNQFNSRGDNMGFAWDVGAQYRFTVKKKNPEKLGSKDIEAVFGAYANGFGAFTVKEQRETIRSEYLGRYLSDTVFSSEEIKNELTMPISFGAGISFMQRNRWEVGINYESQLWSQLKINDIAASDVANAWKIAIGGEWIPDSKDRSLYFNTMRYRFGAFYSKDYRALTNSRGEAQQLTSMGISLGTGFPLLPPKAQRIHGFVNLGVDVGTIGHKDLIQDLYVRVRLGFTLTDTGWFSRYKFR